MTDTDLNTACDLQDALPSLPSGTALFLSKFAGMESLELIDLIKRQASREPSSSALLAKRSSSS